MLHLDRLGLERDDPEALGAHWANPGRGVVVVHDQTLDLAGALDGDAAEMCFLGVVAGRPWFARDARPGEAAPATVVALRDGTLSEPETQVALAAQAIVNWHRVARHCVECGAATEPVSGGFARRCTACGSLSFPRTDPAMIVLVVDRADRLLLAHQGSWGRQRMSLLAGFVEAGESAEQCVVREVHEECALRIERVSYVSSQPWPFPRSLMLGFIALAEGEPVVDGQEIHSARWFTRPELEQAITEGEVALSPPGSIARQLIDRWRAGALGVSQLVG